MVHKNFHLYYGSICLQWFNNEQANEVKNRLASGKDIKIVYDMPWYWQIFANHPQR